MKPLKYPFRISPITPFHIGNGTQYDPLNLIIKNGTAYFINQIEYIRYLMEKDKKELDRNLEVSNIKQLHKFFAESFDPNAKDTFYFSYPVKKDICDTYAKNMENLQNQGFIQAFIRSTLNMQPYIPGSSIKGAIRTAVLSNICSDKNKIIQDRNTDKADQKTQAVLLEYWNREKNSVDVPSDPFKFIKFEDIPWKNDWIRIFGVEITTPPVSASVRQNPFHSGNQSEKEKKEPPIPVLMEVALSRIEWVVDSELTVLVTDKNNRGFNKIMPSGPNDIKPLIKMVNNYYQQQIDRESEYYKSMNPNAQKNYKAIKGLFDNLKDNECIIKLGMGTGQNYCSYAVMNYQPKSRRMINSLPMGWMRLTFSI
jgi:CRISPR type III-A-associated RAMP protein Csm5